MNWPDPQPPQWAVDAGCPLPLAGESFEDYVARLNLDCAAITEGIEHIPDYANIRLAAAIQRRVPGIWKSHVERQLGV